MYGKPGGGASMLLPATGAGLYLGPALALGIVLIVVGALLIRRARLQRPPG